MFAPNRAIKCFFHAADLDGHSSAALVNLRFKHNIYNIGFSYDREILWDFIKPSDVVFLVDLSFKAENMIKMRNHVGIDKFVWIDHHQTAIEDSIQNGYDDILGLRREGLAGCELTWQFLYNENRDNKMPVAIRLLGRYDVWDFEDSMFAFCDHNPKDIIPFQYGMRAENTFLKSKDNDRVLKLWNSVITRPDYYKGIINSGKSIYKYLRKEWDINSKYSTWVVNFEGLRLITTSQPGINSAYFENIFDPDEHDACCRIGIVKDKYNVSLYGPPNGESKYDLSIIAKKYSGGGHKNACGYHCDLDHIINNFLK
jgi:oligoribonuclease NrnB/cAMP/cGMP phosphodiesterase (DHH superfamily)